MTDIVVTGAGGEYMETVTVVEWLRGVGDPVKAGDAVVVVETAKAATEIEAPASGTLAEIRAAVGAEVEIGGVLGVIEGADAAVAQAGTREENAPDRIVASPLARRVASLHGIDLGQVMPTSPSGRIKLRDVEKALAAPVPAVATSAPVRGSGSLAMRRRAGDGTPIVFLHGFGADSLSWHPVLASLRSGNATVCVDLPAHGRSPLLPAADVRAIGAVVASALEDEGLNRVHLVGHSLGGATALAIAEDGRIDIRSLTLIAPAGLGAEIDGSFIDGFTRAARAESLAPWLRRLVADESLISPAFVSAAMQARENAALREAQAGLAARIFPDGTQAADFCRTFARLGMPRKIVWGMRDGIIPWKHALTGDGKAGLHLLPAVAHMPHFEAAEIVAGAIDEIVKAAS